MAPCPSPAARDALGPQPSQGPLEVAQRPLQTFQLVAEAALRARPSAENVALYSTSMMNTVYCVCFNKFYLIAPSVLSLLMHSQCLLSVRVSGAAMSI